MTKSTAETLVRDKLITEALGAAKQKKTCKRMFDFLDLTDKRCSHDRLEVYPTCIFGITVVSVFDKQCP